MNAAAHELRLINNCAKHDRSLVDKKLAVASTDRNESEPLKELGTSLPMKSKAMMAC